MKEHSEPSKEETKLQSEQETFNGCSPTACGCKSLADCPNNQPQVTVIGQGFRVKKFLIIQEEPRSVSSDRTELSIPSTDLDFDINYDLEVLKEEMKELFDDSGERYTGVILSNRQAELMYNMIIRLETKLKQIWKQ